MGFFWDKWGYPQIDSSKWTSDLEMDDLGVPPISGNHHIGNVNGKNQQNPKRVTIMFLNDKMW